MFSAGALLAAIESEAVCCGLITPSSGSSSVVELLPSKQVVAGSNPVSRSSQLFLDYANTALANPCAANPCAKSESSLV